MNSNRESICMQLLCHDRQDTIQFFFIRTCTFNFANDWFRKGEGGSRFYQRFSGGICHLDRAFPSIASHLSHGIPFFHCAVNVGKLLYGSHCHRKFPKTSRERLLLCFWNRFGCHFFFQRVWFWRMTTQQQAIRRLNFY